MNKKSEFTKQVFKMKNLPVIWASKSRIFKELKNVNSSKIKFIWLEKLPDFNKTKFWMYRLIDIFIRLLIHAFKWYWNQRLAKNLGEEQLITTKNLRRREIRFFMQRNPIWTKFQPNSSLFSLLKPFNTNKDQGDKILRKITNSFLNLIQPERWQGLESIIGSSKCILLSSPRNSPFSHFQCLLEKLSNI